MGQAGGEEGPAHGQDLLRQLRGEGGGQLERHGRHGALRQDGPHHHELPGPGPEVDRHQHCDRRLPPPPRQRRGGPEVAVGLASLLQ